MAQTLKEDVKERILDSAKEEFLEKGYSDSSMRSIAAKAKMTVGNLYRYFKNKEDINRIIVGPTLSQINDLVVRLSSNKVNLESSEISFHAEKSELKQMLDELAEEMVNIYMHHKTEFNILMMHSKLNGDITDWFTNLIRQVILNAYHLKESNHRLDIMSRCYAVSIFSGFREMFHLADVDSKQLTAMVKIYLQSYVNALNTDIQTYTGV